ncbi:TonB-dependent siderophore receptor [Marinomonas rhizomae]|uniref:Iron complex outermembrane receptor protein n=1 Tax=Marinomonas rhizomae TaxID=491948 RepID=A0A366J9X5_9GAMM|nr:TonB-dependent siderophore receptor [Marinomonas rhizomae]RBP83179.1 iron complex outermembrane receptor protein [Marinomonas rhizomae]RNF72522.1 TonB-dependent siderophore receptor [Marinomonas rhizomae]
MKKKSTMTLTLKQNHYAKTALFYCSIITPVIGYAEADTDEESEAFRLSPIIVNDQVLADDDSESVVAKELWVGGKVATSILDTPASVSVITEKEIHQRNASTTEEVLEYTPGTVTGYYSTDDRNDYFQIRGFSATTYRDGLTLGSMRGIREDAYAFERVEVIRGANSTLFGPADPGGSINFVSKQPKFDEFGNAYITYGSNDHKEVGIDVGDTLNEDETLAYRLTGKVKDSDREYDYSKDDSQFIMGGLSWEPNDDTRANLVIDYLKTDSSPNSGGYPAGKKYDSSLFYGEPEYNSHDVERTNISAQITHSLNNHFKVISNLRYSDAEDSFGYLYLSKYSSDTSGTTMGRDYYGQDSKLEQFNGNLLGQYDISFDYIDSSTVFGIEYQDSTTDSTTYYGSASSIDINNPVYSGAPSNTPVYGNTKTDYQTKAVLVQQNFALDDKYILTLGARHDDIDVRQMNYLTSTKSSNDFSEDTFRSAFTYKFTDEVSAYISQVESVAPPSATSTKIVRGEQLEIGAKYSPNNINALFSVAVYDLEKSNVETASFQSSGIIRETIGKNRVKGIDLEARAELTERLSVSGGYSYMEPKITEDDNYEGKTISYTPKHSASIWGHYTLARQDMSVGLGARYIGSYYFSNTNDAKSEDAVIVDASFGYDLTKATQLSMNISNLFGKEYVAGSGSADFYNPGRDITVTLNHSW